MKYVPKPMGEASEASSGGGNRGMAREVAILATLVIVVVGAILGAVVFTADFAINHLSVEREKQLFEYLNRGTIYEPAPDIYAEKWKLSESILKRLKSYPETPDLDFRLTYTDEKDPNAYALPGGTICLTRGLLESLDEEISFAFVLSHEIGHFAHRDHLRGIVRSVGLRTALSILFGGSADEMVSKGADLVLLHYSRVQEAKADDFALACIDHIYGNREGAERLFEVLEEQGGQLPGWAYMFNTHPDNRDRLEKILESRL